MEAGRIIHNRRALHLGFACPNTAPQSEIAGTLTPEIRERLGKHCAFIPDTLESFGLSKSQFAGRNHLEVIDTSNIGKRV